jgi:hypothetical protein
VLGAPSPQDTGSEVVHNDVLQSSLLDPGAVEGASPNMIYTAPSNGQPMSSSNPGTLIINRVLTNCYSDERGRLCQRSGVRVLGADGDPVAVSDHRALDGRVRRGNRSVVCAVLQRGK